MAWCFWWVVYSTGQYLMLDQQFLAPDGFAIQRSFYRVISMLIGTRRHRCQLNPKTHGHLSVRILVKAAIFEQRSLHDHLMSSGSVMTDVTRMGRSLGCVSELVCQRRWNNFLDARNSCTRRKFLTGKCSVTVFTGHQFTSTPSSGSRVSKNSSIRSMGLFYKEFHRRWFDSTHGHRCCPIDQKFCEKTPYLNGYLATAIFFVLATVSRDNQMFCSRDGWSNILLHSLLSLMH